MKFVNHLKPLEIKALEQGYKIEQISDIPGLIILDADSTTKVPVR